MPRDTPDGELPKVTKTCRCELDGGDIVLPIGEFTLTEPEPGPKHSDFADAAFKFASASLRRLMVPRYRVVVIDGEQRIPYGLERWVKLVDRSQPDYEPKKQRVHKTGAAK